MPSKFIIAYFFLSVARFCTTSPVFQKATALPELVPGPGLPSLETLNITVAELLAIELPDSVRLDPASSFSKGPELQCATDPERFTSPLEIRTCYGYLITAGTRRCEVPARKPDDTLVTVFCRYGATVVGGISLTGNPESSYCLDIAKSVATITQYCARPQDGWVAGYNTANGNGNIEVGVARDT